MMSARMNARMATPLARCLGRGGASVGRVVGFSSGSKLWRLVDGGEAGASVVGVGSSAPPPPPHPRRPSSASPAAGFATCSPWHQHAVRQSEETSGRKGYGGSSSSSSSCDYSPPSSFPRRSVSSSSSSSSSKAMAPETNSSKTNVPQWKSVIISGIGKGSTMSAQCGKHQLTTDQPVKLGGQDLGTDPMSMLLASLLGCEQYVVNCLAKDLSMDIHSVAYEVQGDYDVRGFLGDAGVPSHFQRVRINASVISKEPEEKLAELGRIVQKRCPVADLFRAAGVDLQVKFVKV